MRRLLPVLVISSVDLSPLGNGILAASVWPMAPLGIFWVSSFIVFTDGVRTPPSDKIWNSLVGKLPKSRNQIYSRPALNVLLCFREICNLTERFFIFGVYSKFPKDRTYRVKKSQHHRREISCYQCRNILCVEISARRLPSCTEKILLCAWHEIPWNCLFTSNFTSTQLKVDFFANFPTISNNISSRDMGRSAVNLISRFPEMAVS